MPRPRRGDRRAGIARRDARSAHRLAQRRHGDRHHARAARRHGGRRGARLARIVLGAGRGGAGASFARIAPAAHGRVSRRLQRTSISSRASGRLLRSRRFVAGTLAAGFIMANYFCLAAFGPVYRHDHPRPWPGRVQSSLRGVRPELHRGQHRIRPALPTVRRDGGWWWRRSWPVSSPVRPAWRCLWRRALDKNAFLAVACDHRARAPD